MSKTIAKSFTLIAVLGLTLTNLGQSCEARVWCFATAQPKDQTDDRQWCRSRNVTTNISDCRQGLRDEVEKLDAKITGWCSNLKACNDAARFKRACPSQ